MDDSGEVQKIEDLLRQINDCVFVFSNRQTCLEFINGTETENIFLILSGQSIADIIDNVQSQKQVDSLYAFCMKRENYEHYLNSHHNYSKLIGIYTEHESLLKAVQDNIKLLRKQLDAASIFDQDERGMRSLKHAGLHDYNIFHVFKETILNNMTDFDRKMAREEMIEICRSYYRGNKKEQAAIDDFQQTYEPKNAIYWYTKQCFVYRLVNKALRTEDYEALLRLRFFIVDLSRSLGESYEHLRSTSTRITSYRGLKLHRSEIYRLRQNIGKEVATNGYYSTSASREIAYSFATKPDSRQDVERVLLEIDVDLMERSTPLADIALLSCFPYEKEVLFDLGACFRIDDVRYDETEKVWLLKLSAVPTVEKHTLEAALLRECREIQADLLLGELLYKSRQYIACRKYFKSLNKETPEVLEYVAHTYDEEGEYDKAIELFQKAISGYILSNQLEQAARVTINIGIAFSEKQNKANAQHYFTRAYDMYTKQIKFPQTYCQIGRIMNFFGTLEEENKDALDYFTKALNIYENPPSSVICRCSLYDHEFNIAQVCGNIGDCYFRDKNDKLSLQFYIRQECILNKYLCSLSQRQQYLICLMKICVIYVRENDQELAARFRNRIHEFADSDAIEQLHLPMDELGRKYILIFKGLGDSSSDDLLTHELRVLKELEKMVPRNMEKIAETHLNIGVAYTKTKDTRWASEHFRKAVELSSILTPEMHFNLGKHLLTNLQMMTTDSSPGDDIAIHFFLKFLESSVAQDDDCVLQGLAYENMANICFRKLDKDTAKQNAQRAIPILEKHLDGSEERVSESFISAHNYMAVLCQIENDYEKSIGHYISILNFIHAQAILNPITLKRLPAILMHFSSVLLAKKECDTALTILENTLPLIPEADESLATATLYFNLGLYYMSQKQPDYNRAIKNYEEALKQCVISQQLQGGCLLNTAFCYSQMNNQQNNDKSLDYTLKALDIYRQHCPNEKNIITSCYLLVALCLLRKGEFDESIENAQIALKMSHELNSFLDLIKASRLLGLCLYLKADYAKALTQTKTSMMLYEKVSTNDETAAEIYQAMARCLLRLKKYDDALEFAKKALLIREELFPRLHYQRAESYCTVALIDYQCDKEEESSALCQKAEDMLAELVENNGKADTISYSFEDLAELFLLRAEMDKVRKYYEKAIDHLNKEKGNSHPEVKRLHRVLYGLA